MRSMPCNCSSGRAVGPIRCAAWYSSSSSTRPSASSAPASVGPASTCTSLTSRRPSSARVSRRLAWPASLPTSCTSAPVASRASRRSGSSSVVTTSTGPGSDSMRAVAGICSQVSTTTRNGCGTGSALPSAAASRRRLSCGSSASTVPMPVSTASARPRQRCTSRRAASPVIQVLSPDSMAVRASRLLASLTRTQGRPVRMRFMKPGFRASACAAIRPWAVSMPAVCKRASP